MTTKINPSEISSIIKKKIDDYKGAATEANVGEVLSTADGIVQIYGLEDAMYGELLDFGEGTSTKEVSPFERFCKICFIFYI